MVADQQLMSLKPGTVISGRYEVVRSLGAGSMGVVYACRHRELSGQLVAVKVLFPEVAQDRVAAARFRNEIQASYGVSHPNVVRAYEFIRDGELMAYTMEYVGGCDVAEKLSDPSKLMPLEEILSIVIQMCLGVQAIHDAGIVHRDLKPENILLTKEGHVKIADFGIAKAGNGPRLTEHGGVVGTIDYVSPEYMMNAQVDWRSDIYAMGVLLYEMLTGTSPFKADSVYATMTKRLKTDPSPPSSIRSECPEELDRVVARAMQRDPELRYQSAFEMGEDLIQVNAMLGFSSRLAGTTSARSSMAMKAPSLAEIEPVRTAEPVKVKIDLEQPVAKINASDASAQALKSSLLDPADAAKTMLIDTASQQMESVLSGKVSVFDTWDTSSQSRAARASKRSRAPSGDLKTKQKAPRSIWPDILLLIIAVGVGVTVGLVVLKVFAAQILGVVK